MRPIESNRAKDKVALLAVAGHSLEPSFERLPDLTIVIAAQPIVATYQGRIDFECIDGDADAVEASNRIPSLRSERNTDEPPCALHDGTVCAAHRPG